MATRTRTTRMTIVAIPFFLPGHIIPMLRLCKHLVASTGSRAMLLKVADKEGESASEQAGVEVLPCLRMPHFTARMFDPNAFADYLSRFNSAIDDAMAVVQSPVSCVISDVYVGFAPQLASRLGVPWIALWTSTAAELLIYSSVPQLTRDGVFPFAGPPSDAPFEIQGLPRLKPADYPGFELVRKDMQFVPRIFTDLVQQALSKSHKLLLNSVYELEKDAIEALKSKCNAVPIGPLHLLEEEVAKDEDAALQWLDKQAKTSVIYIAFGTTIPVSQEQIRELSFALEESGVNFLWSLRENQESHVPQGFPERTRHRGLVVPWAPQMKVLRHPSTAGFFTHCGWNSTMEAISAGVPMVTRPLMSEQMLTQKFLVDEWGIGLRLEAADNLVHREDIKKALKNIFQCAELRSKVEELSSVLISATRENGSSWNGLSSLSEGFHVDNSPAESGLNHHLEPHQLNLD